MDPPLDPPPLANEPTADVPATAAAAAAANPSPTHPPAHNHPPYAEMITAAVAALNERNGSSKRAIAKYIETHYSNLPPTHSALLTHHLKRLKINGQLLMVKHSYKLPRSTHVAVNGAVNAVSSDPASAAPKRRPGRPPKSKPEDVQAAVPVFAPPMNMSAVPVVVPGAQPPHNEAIGPGTMFVSVGPVNGPARGRGRPPKQGGFKKGPGRPPKIGGHTAGGGGVGRGRGRPKQNAVPAALAARKGSGRPRGRPPKPINVVEGLAPGAPVAVGVATLGASPVAGGGVVPMAGKRRGRPPKAGGEAKKPRNMTTGQPKKPRKPSGKPLGRPKKSASATGTQTSDSQLLVAYLDLKAKLENIQSRVQQTAIVIKPNLNSEAAISAFQELETVAMMNIYAPSNAQSQQPQPAQPQPEQPQPQS